MVTDIPIPATSQTDSCKPQVSVIPRNIPKGPHAGHVSLAVRERVRVPSEHVARCSMSRGRRTCGRNPQGCSSHENICKAKHVGIVLREMQGFCFCKGFTWPSGKVQRSQAESSLSFHWIPVSVARRGQPTAENLSRPGDIVEVFARFFNLCHGQSALVNDFELLCHVALHR